MILSGGTEPNRHRSVMILSRSFYEKGIFRDSGPGTGVKAASAFGCGLSNKRMIKNVFTRIFCLFALLGISNAFAVDAFPGEEGSDRFATGGCGGTVYEVNNLNNSGTGSIVDAVSRVNRTVVFKVSGAIELGAVLLEPKSNITIAGQTTTLEYFCRQPALQLKI